MRWFKRRQAQAPPPSPAPPPDDGCLLAQLCKGAGLSVKACGELGVILEPAAAEVSILTLGNGHADVRCRSRGCVALRAAGEVGLELLAENGEPKPGHWFLNACEGRAYLGIRHTVQIADLLPAALRVLVERMCERVAAAEEACRRKGLLLAAGPADDVTRFLHEVARRREGQRGPECVH